MKSARTPFGVVRRIIGARPRLFIGLCCGLLAALVLPSAATVTARWIGAWDIGVGVHLILALHLFLTEDQRGMAAHAARQEEGEWTIFGITVGVVFVSFVTILEEFSGTASLHGATKAQHVGLVATTLLLSWLMTQFTFAFRYAHEYY